MDWVVIFGISGLAGPYTVEKREESLSHTATVTANPGRSVGEGRGVIIHVM